MKDNVRFLRFHNLVNFFGANPNNIYKEHQGFHVFASIQPDSLADTYEVEFENKLKKENGSTYDSLNVYVYGLGLTEQKLKDLPHIYHSQSDMAKDKTCICLFLNGEHHKEFTDSSVLQNTLIPWTFEWLHFYELYLITGHWFGNGEHPKPSQARPLESK